MTKNYINYKHEVLVEEHFECKKNSKKFKETKERLMKFETRFYNELAYCYYI